MFAREIHLEQFLFWRLPFGSFFGLKSHFWSFFNQELLKMLFGFTTLSFFGQWNTFGKGESISKPILKRLGERHFLGY